MSRLPASRTVTKIIIDTSIIIAYLRKSLSIELMLRTIEGRAPVVSPVTVHELRRGVRPGSTWESSIDRLVPSQAVMTLPPSSEDWMLAADVIRFHFTKSHSKEALATLTHDVLIVLTAKNLHAEVWSRDQDFRAICQALGVSLLDH